jgi:hypothetical protein
VRSEGGELGGGTENREDLRLNLSQLSLTLIPFSLYFTGVVFAKILRLDKLPRVTATKIRVNMSAEKKAAPKQQRHYSQPQNSRPAPYSDLPPTHAQMPVVPEGAPTPSQRKAPTPTPAPAPAPPPAPPPKPETRIERLQRERKEREKNQEKVWDEVSMEEEREEEREEEHSD